ncbi:MAG: hypothetical protein WCC17_01915 [Candidatus Nitrosopolaris sp.]
MSRVTSIDKDQGHGNTINGTVDIITLKPCELITKEEYANLVPQISEQDYQ